MEQMNFDRAVDRLDDFLSQKTVHSVKSIREVTLSLCNDHDWATVEDQQDFANICSNFDKYCKVHKTTSFGRKQFEAAWEKNFHVEDSIKNAVKMMEQPKWEVNSYGTALIPIKNTIPDIISEALEEDVLPEDLFKVRTAVDDDGTDWEPCMKTHIWNNRECPQCRIQELEAEVRELRKSLKGIKELLNPWA